jgi:sulfite oxidase
VADYEPDNDKPDFYAADPVRPASQLVLSDRPWSSETDVAVLAQHPLTPNQDFYVRNHAPVPVIDPKAHRICFGYIDGHRSDVETTSFSLDELEAKFGKHRITSVLQCGGNRGGEMMALGTTAFSGTPYYDIGPGMLGCAAWAGVKLRDVLAHVYPELFTAGDKEAAARAGKHVVFEGADGYVASFPLAHVADPANDALLVTEMNDEPLPPDHGAPVRVLMPGSIGARNVKWVTKIRISDAETDACWNGVYYKHGDGAYVLEQGEGGEGRVPTMLTLHQKAGFDCRFPPTAGRPSWGCR